MGRTRIAPATAVPASSPETARPSHAPPPGLSHATGQVPRQERACPDADAVADVRDVPGAASDGGAAPAGAASRSEGAPVPEAAPAAGA
ncbi:hypothetical protein [Streptomyces sp. NRRL F-5135]|uniref:hypothetical protein n=1 Tax=Streptomyces sp. NRRL F-5135 TaxID=1463858 RepID=UPI000A420001|nr:hypothetical protein [Streptomyces sp. NRRL F-5135]